VAVVVHTNAGAFEDDIACRAQQLVHIRGVLAALPAETSIAMAGDFNLDPELYQSEDAAAFEALVAELGLSRLGGYQESHRISHVTLDHLLVRGPALALEPSCEARYLDEGEPEVMLDHAWVMCR
jgi:endonuclease/exonuclease/phosphatase (EEP) superfamily protein YafD